MNAERNLKLFLEKGYVTKLDRKLSLLLPFYKTQISKRVFSKITTETQTISNSKSNLFPALYTGNNSVVKGIQHQLQEAKLPALKAAIVHGSIADGNEIKYSDFDGILIIDPREIKSASDLEELHQLIKSSEYLFFQQDALQHHGWAIFLLSELLDFKDHLFPADLIQNGKAIYSTPGFTIDVRITSTNEQYKIILKNLCTSIIHKASHLSTLENQYIFKNILSEIMLLPAAFLQAKNHKTISKRDSFTLLKNEFPTLDSTILDWASEVRVNWKQDPMNLQTQLFHRSKKAGIRLSFLAPKTPKNILDQLNKQWQDQVILLCNSLLTASN